ncbi:MAG: pilus assembly PilX family protein [Candidatus Eiseniibacteriota bacterium]
MTLRPNNERGSAMVLAIGVLAVLAVLAMVIVAVVVSEKRTALADFSGTRAFYSADAASEAGVNWIKNQAIPPQIIDINNNVYLAPGFTAMNTTSQYKYDIQFVRKAIRPGWSVEYKDYQYRITATGVSTQTSESAIDLGATRLYREGY